MMMRCSLLAAACLVLVIAVLAFANETGKSPWPVKLAPMPAHLKLDPDTLKDVDGRKAETLRQRPFSGLTDLVIENLRMHHFLDKKAIMISSGSPDQPRTPDGLIPSYKSITLRNLDIGPIIRVTPGLHMDHIWIGPGHDQSFRPDVTLENIFLHDGNNGVMPILFESGGKWGTLTLRRVAMSRVAHPVMIKLHKSSFKEIIIEDCPRLRVALQGDGDPVTVRVINSPGADVQTPRDQHGKCATNVTIVREAKPTTQPVASGN